MEIGVAVGNSPLPVDPVMGASNGAECSPDLEPVPAKKGPVAVKFRNLVKSRFLAWFLGEIFGKLRSGVSGPSGAGEVTHLNSFPQQHSGNYKFSAASLSDPPLTGVWCFGGIPNERDVLSINRC